MRRRQSNENRDSGYGNEVKAPSEKKIKVENIKLELDMQTLKMILLVPYRHGLPAERHCL